MTVDELIARARSQIGLKTRYALGGGTVSGEHCRDGRGACDCSGFVLWCLGWPRRDAGAAWLKRATNGWINTDGLWYDATEGPGAWVTPCDRAPGALIVYPASWMSRRPGPKVGHIGILTAPDRVIHCSSGNQRRCGDAIGETDTAAFDRVLSLRTVWPRSLSPTTIGEVTPS